MTRENVISKRQARRLALAASGLHRPGYFGRGINATARAINQIKYVQIDTISVVQRSHHHILWSRVPNYQNSFIHKLQVDRIEVFEYWAHAAAYLPLSDFRFSLPQKEFFRQGKDRWPKSEKTMMRRVLKRIKEEGPLMAKDFAKPRKHSSEGWWDWKPEKLALERLFFQGDLMVVKRKGFHKVYDLTERVLPSHITTEYPSDAEWADHLIKSALSTHGLASLNEITYLRQGVKKMIMSRVADLVDAGKLVKVKVKGLGETPFYLDPDLLSNQIRVSRKLSILSPFDPLIIQRNRLYNFFDFNYLIECYVPKQKRKYGYFVLPVLWRDQLIARMDAKADRKNKTLQIITLIPEPKIDMGSVGVQAWRDTLNAFARFNQCNQIELQEVRSKNLKSILGKGWSIDS